MQQTRVRHFAARLAGALFVFLCPPLQAATYCNECLEKALELHAERDYKFIENAWRQYAQASAALKQIEAGGNAQEIASAKALWMKLRDNWTRAEKMAQGYSSPAFVAHLEAEKKHAAERVAQGQTKLKKETDLFRRLENSTFGPQREGVLRDIRGYEKEAEHLKEMVLADALTFGLHSAEYGGTEFLADKVKHAKEGSAMAAFLRWGQAKNEATFTGINLVREGKELDHARRENADLEAYAAGAKLAGESALRFAKLVAGDPPAVAGSVKGAELVSEWGRAAAHKGPVVIAIAALAMDTYMVCEAVKRLDAADKRIVDLETQAKAWRLKIGTAGEELTRARRSLELQDAEITRQKKMAALYEQIRTEQAK